MNRPAVHFVVLGALLYAARAWWTPAVPPTDGELLYREALAIGLDEHDPLVRERLAKLGAFLAADGVVGEPEDDARALGMVEHDAVIRRHLVQVMRLALSSPTAADRPTDADIDAWLAANAGRVATLATTSLMHVYFARDRHDAGAAMQALARVRGGDPVTGDAFVHGARIEAASADALDRQFGPGFAAAIADAPVGTWTGPIASVYGEHLVRVDARLPGGPPTSAAVRRQAALAIVADRRAARYEERLAALRAR